MCLTKNAFQLEAVFAMRLKWLRKKIAQLYLEEVKRFDHTRNRIDQFIQTALGPHPLPATARSVVAPSTPYAKDPYPAQYGGEVYLAPYGKDGVDTLAQRVDGEFWQPYIFDTGVGNRQGNKCCRLLL